MNRIAVVEILLVCLVVLALALCAGCSKDSGSEVTATDGGAEADAKTEEQTAAEAEAEAEVEAEEAEAEGGTTAAEESDEVITTDSGLKYIDIEVGDGATPTTGQTVVVHYTGRLVDGTKFDSSVDRDDPIVFTLGVGAVIPGWDEGLSTMKVGGRRMLMIPSELAYGADGRPPVIPPNAELHFEVELMDIK